MCGVGVARTWKREEQRPGVPGMEHLQAGPGVGEQEGRQYRAGARARAESGAIIGTADVWPHLCGAKPVYAVRSEAAIACHRRVPGPKPRAGEKQQHTDRNL